MRDHEATIEERFETLKAHVETLPDKVVQAYQDQARAGSQTLIDWTNAGHAVAAYITARDNPDALTHTDAMGRTALHYAAKDHSGLLARILTDTHNAAPFREDADGKTPLDHAGLQQNTTMQTVLFPLTYPDLFVQAEIAQENKDDHLNNQTRTYAEKRQEFETLGSMQKQRNKERDI